jgi:hypothetical protein
VQQPRRSLRLTLPTLRLPPPQVFIMTKESGITGSEPVQWAIDKLKDALTARGILVSNVNPSVAYGSGTNIINIIAVTQAETASREFDVPALPPQPETVALSFWWLNNSANYTVVAGVDVRGLVYGLLELAERVRDADNPIAALQQQLRSPLIETTPNKVRSVARAFVSETEDKEWFYDRAFWTAYLDTLVAARFNRFNFTLGIGWDFPRGVTGDYFHFPYPYLVEVPGYGQVHVEPALQPGERQRNLETLQFIAAETARRGMDFQLGIWTHAYQWTDSPNSDHHIVGLTPEIHAAYCRDALAVILKDCPQITGLTLRIHGESGIPEGSYPFWQTLFEAIPAARTPDGKPRVIEIEMHAKGLDQKMIEIARATGMPVKAGAKYWAEHWAWAINRRTSAPMSIRVRVSPGPWPYPVARATLRDTATEISTSRTSGWSCCTACGRGRSATCCGAIPRWPPDMDGPPTSVERQGWNSWNR